MRCWASFHSAQPTALNISGAEFVKAFEDSLVPEIAAREVRLKNELAEKQRFDKVKKGDFSQAKSCAEVVEAIGNTSIKMFAYEVLVKPSQGLYLGGAQLAKHVDSTGGSEELVEGVSSQFAKLRINGKTIILGEQNRKIGSMLTFVGKYSSNSSVTLTSGRAIDIAVLDVSCAEYQDVAELLKRR